MQHQKRATGIKRGIKYEGIYNKKRERSDGDIFLIFRQTK